MRRIILISVVTLGPRTRELKLTSATIVNILFLLIQMAAQPYLLSSDDMHGSPLHCGRSLSSFLILSSL
jgi:hypothetical protein